MAIVYVSVTGQILAADGAPAVGDVIFQIPVTLRDVVDNIVYTAGSTFTETLDVNGDFTFAALPSTDSPDVTPADWLYRVHVHTDIWSESFSTSLPAAFAPIAEFADLVPTETEPCTTDGTPCATLAQFAALQAELDALEAAVTALDGLVVHKAGAENITGVKTFVADPIFNAGGILQASVANLVADLASKINLSTVDAKGDLLAGTADDTIARLAVGTDGQIVYSNPVTATGLEWRARDPDMLAAGMTTLDRHLMGSNTNVALGAASGNLRLAYFTAPRAETWSQVGWTGGTVAAGATPTLVRWGLYTVAVNGDLTLVASTPNDTALFAVASTPGVKAFSVAHVAVAGQRYAIGILVVSGVAIPSIQGVSLNQATAQSALAPRITGVIPAMADLPLAPLSASINPSNCVLGAQILP